MWTLALSLAKRFWPAIVGTLALLAAYLWHVGEIKEARADEREKVTLAYQKALQKALIDQERISREASSNYQDELGRILGSPLPAPVIRVLYNAPTDPVSITVSGSDEARQAGGVLPEAATRDIGPELDALMREADACSAQLRALQEFDRKRSALK